MSSNDFDPNKVAADRRTFLRVIAIGGVATAVMLPSRWMKPIVNSVIVPAHAASSAPSTTGIPSTTGAPTTTAAPTTEPPTTEPPTTEPPTTTEEPTTTEAP